MTKVFRVLNFPFVGNKNKGLFDFLRESQKYPLSKNIIVVNSSKSKVNPNSYDPMKPFGIGTAFSWMSDNIENSWLMVTFPNFKVKIDSYSILFV